MPSNHNQQPSTPDQLTTEERSLFDISKVKEWRTRQYGILNGLRANSTSVLDTQYVEDFTNSIDSTLDDFLESQGIDVASVNYNEVRELYRGASIDRINENEWGNSPASRGVDSSDRKSGSDVFAERIADRLGSLQGGLDDRRRAERDAEFGALEAEVVEARELLAVQAAKRQGRLFTLDRSNYDELRSDYFSKVQALGERHLIEHADYTEEDKNLIALTILFDEQEKLRELTREKLAGTKVGKFVGWMNKGGKLSRAGKGVLLGIGAGVAGSFLAGAVGAGIVAGGAVAASRFARGYSAHDKERGMKSYEDTMDVSSEDLNISNALNFADDDTRLNKTSRLIGDQEDFEAGTRREQSKRRKAFAWGAGSIAVGAALGYGIHNASEYLSDRNLTTKDWISGKVDNVPSVDGDIDEDPTDGAGTDVNEGNGTGEGTEPDGGADTNKDTLSWSKDAVTVTHGEGFYQTFQEMGIPEEYWAEVIEDVGPKLQNRGWAYFDSMNNEWRISHTGDLSDVELGIVSDSAKRAGFTFNSL
ncbi:hypothetical protein H6796_00870 [Candidatus Nomurabacteria bacterium]|nr:hypothetical protein [Candidatus Nomurabacteria bacterium]